MTPQQITRRASAITFATGAFWGLYWLPVRGLDALGLSGAWGTLAIACGALLLLSPVAWRARGTLAGTSRLALLSIMLGGAAFALYSVAFLYGRVAITILLYFLTPVWSVLIGRFVMGWPVAPMRLAAILVGLAGLGVMLSAEGTLPIPRSLGEWMGLAAGLLWSFGTTGMRSKSDLAPLPSAFVFAMGAALTALALAPILGPLPTPDAPIRAAALALATGGLWWVLSTSALMWATVRLEPARVGILLMAEVLLGALTAAIFAGEHLHPLEIAGGTMVLVAGLLEVWPTRQPSA